MTNLQSNPAWSALTGKERGKLLLKLADKITEARDELNELEALATGKPIFASQLETTWGTDYLGTIAVRTLAL